MLIDTIQADYKSVWKNKDKEATEAYRYLIGEFQRFPTKIPTDDQCISYMKKLKKDFSDGAKLQKENAALLSIVSKYIPAEISKDEIIVWIKTNVEFDSFSNKMQAMKQIMSHFGQSVDGNIVKTIIQENF